ncbi:MAG: hypothetical protein RBG13Loki_0855 [Promethearchaeota archaeon CR_4]|nr:MAG: hypothetical protein RBG13Loki_0855 [Candidatus Lokiarchaeota archaeon CR_4]
MTGSLGKKDSRAKVAIAKLIDPYAEWVRENNISKRMDILYPCT